MKKNIIAVSLAFSVLTFSSYANAAGVGVVDTKKLFEGSKLFDALTAAKKELAKAEEDLKKETLYKSKLLEEARSKKLSEEAMRKMQEAFQLELENKRKEGQALSEKKQKELEDMSNKLKSQIDDTIKSVAKDKQLDVVVDKQAVLFGGTDITDDVIKKIK